MALVRDKDVKLYYSIREVSGMFGVNASTLRFWEKEFPEIHPVTNARGVRQYTAKDIEAIRLIHNLIRVRGFKIEAARKMLGTNRTGADKSAKVIDTLLSMREELTAIKRQLDSLV